MTKMSSSNLCTVLIGLFVLISFCEAQQECTPGQTKKLDCNNCFCTNGGVWGCTLKACLGDKIHKRQVVEENKVCTPGESKQHDCNTCVCLPIGQWACTLIGCNHGPFTKRNVQTQPECRAGETMKLDCNDCFCSETGFWACTLKGCLHEEDIAIAAGSRTRRAAECKEGETTKIECNDCFCTKTGDWACTEKACPKGVSKRDAIAAGFRAKREAPVAVDLQNTPCAPNDYFNIDCNTCYCKTDKTGYLCTQNVCTGPDHKDILTTSEPDEFVANKTKANTTIVSNNNEENSLLLSPDGAPSASGRSAGSDPIFDAKSSPATGDIKVDQGAAKTDSNSTNHNVTNLEPSTVDKNSKTNSSAV